MTEKMENTLNHIKTSVDVDPWAVKEVERVFKVFEDIRQEIEHVIDNTYDSTDYDTSLYNGAYKDGLYEALDIIDKHIGERRE